MMFSEEVSEQNPGWKPIAPHSERNSEMDSVLIRNSHVYF